MRETPELFRRLIYGVDRHLRNSQGYLAARSRLGLSEQKENAAGGAGLSEG